MSRNVNASVLRPEGGSLQDMDRLRVAYEKALAQNTGLAVSLQKARTQIAALKSSGGAMAPEGATVEDDVLSLRAERDKFRDELQVRFEEIATLTRLLETSQAQAGRAVYAPHATAIMDELIGYTHALEQSHRGILASTSWRLTGPLRAFISFFSGKKPGPAFQYQLSDIIARHKLPPLK